MDAHTYASSGRTANTPKSKILRLQRVWLISRRRDAGDMGISFHMVPRPETLIGGPKQAKHQISKTFPPSPPEPYERPPVILTCSGCCSLPPAQLGSIILGGWPSWGAPAPQTPRTWRLRRQQERGGLRPSRPKWGAAAFGRAPTFWGSYWRRRSQVRGGWGRQRR